MGGWGFWEWLTYGCIAVAALMLAVDAAVKQSPDLNTRFGAKLASRTWAFTLFVLILISAIVIASRHLTPAHDSSSALPEKTISLPAKTTNQAGLNNFSPTKKRVFVAFGPDYLLTLLKGHRLTEKTALFNLYQNEWMKVEGTVGSVLPPVSSESGVSVFVVVSKTASLGCLFDQDQSNTPSTLQHGAPVTVIGQITTLPFSEGDFILEHCEIVSFTPQP